MAMADDEETLKLSVNVDALAMIDKECRARGMNRSEFFTRAALSFCGASPFTDAEEKEILKIVNSAIKSHTLKSHG